MASGFIGRWVLDKNENYVAFLKACGMGSMKSGMYANLGSSISVSKVAEDRYKFTVCNGPNMNERVVTFGQEFEEDGIFQFEDGGKVKGKWEVVDGKLVGNFTGVKGNQFKFTREIVDGRLVQTMEAGAVVAKRFYKKF